MTKSHISLIVSLFFTLIFTANASTSFDNISDKLIRFHVVANSNEDFDQKLKLEVKDEVFYYISDITENLATNEDAYIKISENLDVISDMAEKIVFENGYDYEINIDFENEYFPQKNYGEFSLPAGHYTGLKINIGDAKGENYFCVLFPPLCNEIAYDTKDLTTKELDFISSEDIEFAFKFIDIYENVKHQINEVF